MDPLDAFVTVAHRIVWANLATVDRRGRPRSRLVHPVWERHGDALVGLVASRPTPLRRAHVADHPHVSVAYWDPAHETAVAECAARWLPAGEHEAAWERLRSAPEPAGYDPRIAWPDGPRSADFAVLELTPWRLRTWQPPQTPVVWRAVASAA
jgi:hypothetical protein